jgi:hypothetical protein
MNGLGAVSVAGHARCDKAFDARDASGVATAQCVGGRDVVDQLASG